MAKVSITPQEPVRQTPARNTEQRQSADQVSVCIMVSPEQRREIKTFAASLGISVKDLLLRAVREYKHD